MSTPAVYGAQPPHSAPQSQGPVNQQSGPGCAQQGPPQSQGQKPPHGVQGEAGTQAPPPASNPPKGSQSLGHKVLQQQQSQPPAYSMLPGGNSKTTRESKRSPIMDPTTKLEMSVDGTSADRKVRFHPHVPIVLSLILAQKLNVYHFCTLETNPSTHANQQSLRWPKLLSRGPLVKHLLPTPANQRKKVRTRNHRLLTRWRRSTWTRKGQRL